MEDCCLEQDLADRASTSSNQSLNAQHPAVLSQQNSILLQDKNSNTSIWLEDSVYMLVFDARQHCYLLFITILFCLLMLTIWVCLGHGLPGC